MEEAAAAHQALQYGILGVVALIFAFVIRSLYNDNKAERKAREEERKKTDIEIATLKGECQTEKAAMRGEFEKKSRELLDDYAKQLSEDRDAYRRREDDIRREANLLVEKVSASAEASNEAIVEMLQKFYERIK